MLKKIIEQICKLIAYCCVSLLIIYQLIKKFITFINIYKSPLYKLKCNYQIIRLNKGYTEILSIPSKNNLNSSNSTQPNHSLLSNNSNQDKDTMTFRDVRNISGDMNDLKTNIKDASSQIKQENNENENIKDVKIVMFSGNPGYIKFYDRFLSELSEQLNGKLDIFGIGHLGQFNYSGKRIHNDFTLNDQIDQKVEFMNYLIAQYPHSQFILISHSIGTYCVLNMLDRIPAEKILFSYKLYPVIERIKQTPNGVSKARLPYFPFIQLSSLCVQLFSLLPMPIKRFITLSYLQNESKQQQIKFAQKQNYQSQSLNSSQQQQNEKGQNQKKQNNEQEQQQKDKSNGNEEQQQLQQLVQEDLSDVAEVFSHYSSYSNFYSMLYMTRSEFDQLNERQHDILNRHSKKMLLYYGVDDDWCPVEYYHQITAEMPQINSQLDNKGFLHAFVVGGSTLKSQIVSTWIQPLLAQNNYSI